MPNSSATTCDTTVPGLLPQNGQPTVARKPPNASMLSLTLSGVLVSGNGGLSYQNHHSVALYVLRSWQLASPIPMYRASARSRCCS